MKEKIVFSIAFIIAIFLGIFYDGETMFIPVLPFQIIGQWLRALSLSSAFLNIIAWLIFIGLSMIPICLLTIQIIKSKYKLIDLWMLPILSIALGLSLYAFINPQNLINQTMYPELLFSSEDFDLISMIFNGSYAIIFELLLSIYLILKVYLDDQIKLKQSIEYSFIVIIVVLIILGIGWIIPEYISVIGEAENTYVKSFNIIELLFSVSVYVLTIYVLYQIRKFIFAIYENDDDQHLINLNHKNFSLTKTMIFYMLGIQILMNSYQIIFIKHFDDITFSIEFPLTIFIMSLAYMVFAKYFKQTHEVKEENELFI